MDYDRDKVDEMTLALLYLVATERPDGRGAKAWKGFDAETVKRLHKKGWIEYPTSKAISLDVTADGFKKSRELFLKHFGGQANR